MAMMARESMKTTQGGLPITNRFRFSHAVVTLMLPFVTESLVARQLPYLSVPENRKLHRRLDFGLLFLRDWAGG
jgi:hypothetical protein